MATSFALNGHSSGKMAPPPMPIDPALESWQRSPIHASPRGGSDNLLHYASGYPDKAVDPRISESLEGFPQDVPLSTPKAIDMHTDPLLRFWSDRDGPWTAQRVGVNSYPTPVISRQGISSEPCKPSRPSFDLYRDPARSEVESHATERYMSDSGYGTRSCVTKSVLSADHLGHNPDCQGLATDVDGMEIYTEAAPRELLSRDTHDLESFTSATQNSVIREPTTVVSLKCQYSSCNHVSKTQSEQRQEHCLVRGVRESDVCALLENMFCVTTSLLNARNLIAHGLQDSVLGMILIDIKGVNTRFTPRMAATRAFAALHNIARRKKKFGLVLTISVPIAVVCMETWTLTIL